MKNMIIYTGQATWLTILLCINIVNEISKYKEDRNLQETPKESRELK